MSEFIPGSDGFVPRNDQSGEAAAQPEEQNLQEEQKQLQPQGEEAAPVQDAIEPQSSEKKEDAAQSPQGEAAAVNREAGLAEGESADQTVQQGEPVQHNFAQGQVYPPQAAQPGAYPSAYSESAPQGYNGTGACNAPGAYGQRYYNPATGQYYYTGNVQTPPKKKMSGGMKAFIGCMIGLFVILAGAFSVLLAHSFSQMQKDGTGWFQLPSGNDPDSFFSSDGSSAVQSDDPADSSNTAIDPDGPNITLYPQPDDLASEQYNAQYAFKKVSPSVVGVVMYKDADLQNGTSNQTSSQGTGIIISSDGYIVTNSHVIGDSKQYTVTVVLSEEEEYPAQVVGYDTRTDLAVLKIDVSKDLEAAQFASSDDVEVGQDVVAIGNPGGISFSNSLTKGIISAVNRTVSGSNIGYIQTDAAINPGNSGGPLVNLSGQVLGINTIKIVNTEYEGMGFAIPSKTVREIVNDIITQGYVSGRVRIGVTGTEITSPLAQYNNVPTGILIDTFADDSPLPEQGVERNDIITAIDGVEITSFSRFYTELAKYKPGDEVTLSIYRMPQRQGQEAQTFDVEIKLLADNGETQS